MRVYKNKLNQQNQEKQKGKNIMNINNMPDCSEVPDVHVAPGQTYALCPVCGGIWSADKKPEFRWFPKTTEEQLALLYLSEEVSRIKPPGPRCPHCMAVVNLWIDLPKKRLRNNKKKGNNMKPKKGDLLYDRVKNRIVVFWSLTKNTLRYDTNGGSSQPNSALYVMLIPIQEADQFTVWVGGREVNNYYLTGQQAYELAKVWMEDGYSDVSVEKITNKE